MSALEILAALPKLTHEERAAIAQRLRELEEQDALLFLHEAADQTFLELEQKEEANARRKAR